MDNSTISLSPIYDLSPFLSEGEIVAFNVGFSGELLVGVALKALDYQEERKGWAVFAKTKPNETQRYKLLRGHNGSIDSFVLIENEEYNIHDLQILPDNNILLVCARSQYRGPNDFEKNGRIYSGDGKFIREILLGDGIQNTQVTSNGVIWTSYFDEGIFGNFGWEEPVGASGLLAWDVEGKKIFEYKPTKDLDPISDCYALNVVSEIETWCYYYTEFPLVKIKDFKIQDHWEVPVMGSDSFAIYKNFALFRGGYERKDSFYLVKLEESHKASKVKEFVLKNESNNILNIEWIVGRKDKLYILSANKVYSISIHEVLL